jgi:glutathione reductase (NADPH)
VATGGRAFVPDIPGKELCITSDEALNLPAMPKKIAIVGSGYIALEFACIFKQLGAEVHVYYRQPLPLRGFDEEVRGFLAEQLSNKGIHMHHSTTPTSVAKKEGGGLTFTHSDGEIDVDEVMMATGRKPNVANLGLENAGVELLPSGAIKVDEYSRSTCPSIWAIGDVTDRINLTPVALMEGMALSKTLFGGEPTKPDHKNVACAVFTQPQVGVREGCLHGSQLSSHYPASPSRSDCSRCRGRGEVRGLDV